MRDLRIAQGMKADPRVMLSYWVTRGSVILDKERGIYKKANV